jgi:predicted DsbA family dithiol-disulfide isomerase
LFAQRSLEGTAVHVEIWSDIACPWCYVGKRRLEAALADYEHRDDVTVTWRSFELDPGAPADRGMSSAEHLASKYGFGVDQAKARQAQLAALAAEDGLELRFDRARGGNTFDAHRLVHLAEAHGVQGEMKERLMRAYLTEGELVSDPTTLARLAAEVGLPAGDVDELLAGDRFAAEVRDDERTGEALGITGVPFFVVDRAFGASGAQPPEVLQGLLERAWEARPAVEVVTTGESCGVDGC